MSGRAFWDGLAPAELEAHYTPRLAAPGYERTLARLAELSAEVRARFRCALDLPYGPHPLQRLDLVLPERPTGAVHVFLHGGYWRAMDKADHTAVALPMLRAGAIVALPNYRLCPAARIGEVVADGIAGTAAAVREAAARGGDPARVTLSGHSAGAHLAAFALAEDWTRRGLPADLAKGALLASGILDPAPVPRLAVNAEIGMTEEEARRWNAVAAAPRGTPDVLLAVGALEPAGWKDQSAMWRRAHGGRWLEVPGADHFTLALDMADPAGVLGREAARMVSSAPAP